MVISEKQTGFAPHQSPITIHHSLLEKGAHAKMEDRLPACLGRRASLLVSCGFPDPKD
jgi:hypothetical protein